MDAHRIERVVSPLDSRLGRHVNHDPRSRRFAVRPAGEPRRSVRHVRHVPVFDQGSLGSCTGNAALGCLGTGVFYATMDEDEQARWPWDQRGAVAIYSQATRADPFDGEYPPADTGSDGLSVAKVLHAEGLISGYEHAFSLAAALSELQHRPLITGTWWHSGMFDPDDDAVVRPVGRLEGGHEYVGDEFVVAGDRFGPRGAVAAEDMVGFTNSWSDAYGWRGRFYMSAADFGALLDRQGDATFFVPSDRPPPAPDVEPGAEVSPADADLAAAVGAWARRDAICGRRQRAALRTWLDRKGL